MTAELAVAHERRLSGEALVEHAAERVDVGARVDGPALDLLRGGVVEGAEEEPGLRQALRGRRA